MNSEYVTLRMYRWLHLLPGLLLYILCSASPASALEQVTLQLKWMHQFQFAGYYAAVQQGYYREAGLNVTIVPATSGTDPVLEVVNGKADYGVGSSSLLLMRNAGKPVVTLAVIFQHSPYIILTKEHSASQTIHSLSNKRLMLEPQADELVAYLTKEGIPMQRLEHSFNLKDLINGTVDAMSGYITTDPDDLNRAGFAYHAYTPRSAGIDFYGDNIFTTENEIKNHPTRAKAFREASLKGWLYALDHPDEIIDLILSTYTPPGIRADRAHLKYEAEQITQLIQPNLVEIGYMHSGRWRHIADTYNEMGMLPKNIDLKKFMYDPLPQNDLIPFYWIASSLLGLALLIIAARLIKTSRNLKKSEAQVREQYNEIRQMNESLEEQVVERIADLNEAKLLSEQIINCAQEGVVVYDLNLHYQVWNPYMERLTGLTAAEVLGCNALIFFPFLQESGTIERLKNMLIDGIPVTSDFPFYIPSTGVSGWASDVSAPLRDTQGEIIGIIATVRDITEKRLTRLELLDKQKCLEESNCELAAQFEEAQALQEELTETLARLQNSEESHTAIIQSAMDGFWLVDAHGLLLEVNESYCQMSGYSEQELLSMNIADLEYIESTVEVATRIEKIMTTGEAFFETQHRRKDGSFFSVEASVQYWPIKGGQLVTFMRDITGRKHAEENLRLALVATEQATIAKSQFLSNMSHEIRTPLNAIIGFSTLMLKSTLPPIEHDFIKKINTAGETLLNVINDILDFSKIEAGQLNLEQIPFLLEPVLATAISMVQHRALDKNLPLLIKTVPGIAPCLIGDPLRLGQVIVNLLNNAVKFTEHGVVTLEVALLKEEKERQQLTVTIHDTGIGIPPEQIVELFQPFTQADESTTRRFGGTGLGLSICKQLVALMGGEIYCESTPGLGSVFSFTAWFGIGQADSIIPTHAASTTATAYDFSAYHVLLVEDNEVNQQLAIELLKDTGVGVSVASNGSEAVLLVTEGDREYDLVLMDIQMPVMDGYEATRLIRSDSRFARLPIIAMTAHAMQEEQQKILQSGMAAHIPKPIDIRTLLRVMRLFLGEPSAEMLLPNVPAESDGAVADIPVIAGLDVADALDRLDGNGKLYHWLLRSFVENKAEVLKIIDEALQSGDTDLAVRTAHTVKSSAGTIGAVSLELQAQILESAIERGESPETVSAALGSCAVEIERVRAELAKYLPPVAQTADGTLPVAVDEVLVVPALQRLLGYIEGNDCAVERYFDNHHHELHSLPDLDTERLKKHLQNFDFSAAREALLALAEKHGLKLKVRTQ